MLVRVPDVGGAPSKDSSRRLSTLTRSFMMATNSARRSPNLLVSFHKMAMARQGGMRAKRRVWGVTAWQLGQVAQTLGTALRRACSKRNWPVAGG